MDLGWVRHVRVGRSLGQVVEYDVTAAITGDGTYTFDLAPTSTSGFGVASRETTTPPVLVLE